MSRPDGLLPFPFPHTDGLAPLPELADLRRNRPVVKVGLPNGSTAWLVTRNADVRKVLADPRFSRTRAPGNRRPSALLPPGRGQRGAAPRSCPTRSSPAIRPTTRACAG